MNAETEVPSTLAEQVDRLWSIKQARAELAAAEHELKREYDALKNDTIEVMQSVGMGSAESESATAELTVTAVPRVSDKTAFRLHIIQSGELDLLEDRPHKGAIRERWRSGAEVPGVVPVEEFDLSLKRK